MEECRDGAIRKYFIAGYTYLEIQVLLEINEGLQTSLRQLKRHLRRLGLRRRGAWDSNVVQVAIQAEVQGSGIDLGCRSMARRLLTKHGMSVGRDTVLQHQHVLDPMGVLNRSRHCLMRRDYFNKGPNFLIHIDGYDKIKRYGFAIHGAICGFSRQVLWLKVARTNNDPKVIAGYFMQYVQDICGVPRCIRMDAGTENGYITNMQKALRWYHEDRCSGERSVIVGSSHSNQRIEAWWRQLRRMCTNFWMRTFAKWDNEEFFSSANIIHMDCLRFCFTQVIQNELDCVKKEWNEHRVRHQQYDEGPFGKPELLFNHPELFDAVDYKYPVDPVDVDTFREMCTYPTDTGCSEEVSVVFEDIMTRNSRTLPETFEEAVDLFSLIKRSL